MRGQKDTTTGLLHLCLAAVLWVEVSRASLVASILPITIIVSSRPSIGPWTILCLMAAIPWLAALFSLIQIARPRMRMFYIGLGVSILYIVLAAVLFFVAQFAGVGASRH